MSQIINITESAKRYIGFTSEDWELGNKKVEDHIAEKLKKYVREFSLFHEEIRIYKYDAADANSKILSDYGLKNGDKILIQSFPMLETE